MAISFQEIKGYLARDVRLSICFEDGHYHNYLMVSDIPRADIAEEHKLYGKGPFFLVVTADEWNRA